MKRVKGFLLLLFALSTVEANATINFRVIYQGTGAEMQYPYEYGASFEAIKDAHGFALNVPLGQERSSYTWNVPYLAPDATGNYLFEATCEAAKWGNREKSKYTIYSQPTRQFYFIAHDNINVTIRITCPFVVDTKTANLQLLNPIMTVESKAHSS